MCIFQPGNITCWGSEGVKMDLIAAHVNAEITLVVTV